MDKMEEFKKFASSKPFLKKKVENKETTWQELYERYDIYGENDDIFKENEKESKRKNVDSFSSFMDMINNIDIDKITEGLNGMKKVLSILSEVTNKDENTSRKKMNQPYERDID